MILFSNEIVFRGHPDKVCDQISAAILKEYIKQDKNSHCGIEVCGGKGKIFVTGEVKSSATVDIQKTVKRVLHDVGYKTDYEIINNIGIQSQDIDRGVLLKNDEIGAGDQGQMFGFATNETKERLPLAQVILQKLAIRYDELRKLNPEIFYPDGKAQITGEYDEDMHLTKILNFVISYQNCETNREYSDKEILKIANSICKQYKMSVNRFLINPTGKFLIGGFDGDAGLTGRKILVDAYQAFAKVGGGCMNGKDPSKVDFSAAHKARQIAVKFLNECRGVNWCEVQLTYAIGIAEPLSIYITTDKITIQPDKALYKECTPKRIINDLKLLDADYEKLAQFGHFTNADNLVD